MTSFSVFLGVFRTNCNALWKTTPSLSALRDITKELQKQNLEKKEEEDKENEKEEDEKENQQGNAAEQKPELQQEVSKRCSELAPIGQGRRTEGERGRLDLIDNDQSHIGYIFYLYL